RAFGAQPVHQQARFFRDGLQALGFHRHGPPLFLFPLGRPSVSQVLHFLSLSIPDGTCSLVWTKFPNRVINRHLRLIQHVVIDTDLSIDTLELTVRCASTEIASTNGKD